jgi:hypothetical protein
VVGYHEPDNEVAGSQPRKDFVVLDVFIVQVQNEDVAEVEDAVIAIQAY